MTIQEFIYNWTKIKEYFCFNIIGLSQNHLLGSALSEVEGNFFGDTLCVHIQLPTQKIQKLHNLLSSGWCHKSPRPQPIPRQSLWKQTTALTDYKDRSHLKMQKHANTHKKNIQKKTITRNTGNTHPNIHVESDHHCHCLAVAPAMNPQIHKYSEYVNS